MAVLWKLVLLVLLAPHSQSTIEAKIWAKIHPLFLASIGEGTALQDVKGKKDQSNEPSEPQEDKETTNGVF
jgi:hypothetical protein